MTKNWDVAISDLAELIRLEPDESSNFHVRAQIWAEKQEPDKAIADWDEYLRREPNDAGALLCRGDLWASSKGDFDKGIADLTAAIDHSKDNDIKSQAYGFRGYAWHLKRDFEKSIADYSEALRLCPNSPKSTMYHGNRGQALETLGKLDEAIDDFSACLLLDSNDVAAYYHRAQAYQEQGKFDLAAADAAKVAELCPNSTSPHLYRCCLLSSGRRFDDAVAECDDALRIEPNSMAAFALRGYAYLRKGDFERAESDLSRSIRLTSSFQALVCRAYIQLRQSKLEEAIADCTEALRADKNSVAALRVRAAALTQKGEYARAVNDYRELLQNCANDVEARSHLAYLLATCPIDAVRDGASAVENATVANEASKKSNAQVLDTLAAAYAESGDFEKATENQQRALELADSDIVRQVLREHLELYKQQRPLRDRYMIVPVDDAELVTWSVPITADAHRGVVKR
jgi:tetratricopeptide (TPR) repeat protein